jgi:hypothetical protein
MLFEIIFAGGETTRVRGLVALEAALARYKNLGLLVTWRMVE